MTSHTPLPERLRPKTLDEIIGQDHLTRPGTPLYELVQSDHLPSLILWGPPGSGKTTLAQVLAHSLKSTFHQLSAVMDGIKEIKTIIEERKNSPLFQSQPPIVFVDEIHRWNKTQQDALLPHVERGDIILLGATTENPSFSLNSPLLSRCHVYVLNRLSQEALSLMIERALTIPEYEKISLEADLLKAMAEMADGDGRRALITLESLIHHAESQGKTVLNLPDLEGLLQRKVLSYDKKGEEHYNIISAFIKSMRGTDPDAALYWMARMIESGEDPLFIARRMVIFASEDIGNADPRALQIAVSAKQAFEFVGMPEGWIPLAHAATYLASAPKSNASYMAYKKVLQDIKKHGSLPTPLHLRNAPTKLMKELGYGKDYQYPHDFEGHYASDSEESYLPEKLKGQKYYTPENQGYEKKIKEHLETIKKGTR